MLRVRSASIRTPALLFAVPLLLCLLPRVLIAQAKVDFGGVRAIGAKGDTAFPADELWRERIAAAFPAVRLGDGAVPDARPDSAGQWTAGRLFALDSRVQAHRDSLWLAARGAAWAAGEVPPLPGGPLVAAAGDTLPMTSPGLGRGGELTSVLAEYATLGVRLRGRSDFAGSWSRSHPCDGLADPRCDPGFVPRIAPETELGVVVQGTIFSRVHVAVDYDAAREFDASNNFSLFYEGQPGEFLRRAEAGDVSLALPTSRFLTHAVPAGNWGVRATGQAGPLELQALWARQGGEVTTREFRQAGGQSGFAQQASAAWDDAAFAAGQFFFLFDPAEIAGYPHIDVQALSGSEAPPDLVARGLRLYRYSGGQPSQDGSTTLARAAPREPGHAAEAVTGSFRLLQAGADYQLHRSGIWLALKNPLREDEALAVAYVAASGDTVGALVAPPAGAPQELRLLKGLRATHRPGSATWPLEMRQIYRISGSDGVDPSSIRLVISRGEPSGGDLGRNLPATGQRASYLQLFGLDDQLPRDEPDAVRVYRPADYAVGSSLGGVFLIFPTLRPFTEPAPVPSLGLSADDAALVLGVDANPGIYEAPDERARRAAARFRLGFTYATTGQAHSSSISLGAVGVREGSERITVGGRLLERGIDYDIQYDVGEVQLRDAAALFGGNPNAEIRATFEQNPLFGIAPTSVAGLTARYPLGSVGELNLIGLSRQERSLIRRPMLGVEPASLMLGGVSGRLDLGAGWLDRALGGGSAAPGVEAGSRILLSGELALSLPDPNRQGVAYLDDFEESDAIAIPLLRQSWRLGSAPVSPDRLESEFPFAFDAASAGALVWQHDLLGASGRVAGLRAREIDSAIRVAAGGYEPNVLHLTLASDSPAPVWRSITAALSTTGRDLRNQEYLEFYVSGDRGEALVFDLGTTSEDALATDGAGRIAGTDASGAPWGAGTLDREWDPAREVWTSSVHDERGLWDASCRAEPGATYPRGDPLANCTRGNGVQDTEDLNGNGVLDTDERVFRYVVRLGDAASPYLVRDTTETGTGFRLFRVPLLREAAVGAAPSDIQNVKHLRLTVIGRGGSSLALARMRFTGSRWEKRNETGITGGMLEPDRFPASQGRLEVSSVSTVTGDDSYVSPPGVSEGPQDPSANLAGVGASEINESSLRLRYRGLAPTDRAEVYRSYDTEPRNFLAYRQLRVWALPRHGRWGEDGEELHLRVGSGPDNYYLYRTRLRAAVAPQHAGDWGPEIVVDFGRWLRLRAEAEQRLLARDAAELGPLVVWDADSTYAVVVGERGRAPNLAAVRELSLAVWNGGAATADGEVWIGDLRLGGAARDPGAAGEVSLSVRGSDLFLADIGFSNRGAHFHPMDGSPAYQSDAALTINTSIQLGQLLPDAWALQAPLTVQYQRAASDPLFVGGSDLQATSLGEIRRPANHGTRVQLQLGRRPGPPGQSSPGLLDGLRFGLAYQSSGESSPYLASRRGGMDATIEYVLRPAARTLPLLPAVLRGSGALRALAPVRLRWTPANLSFSSGWTDSRADHFRYSSLLLSADSAGQAQRSEQRRLVQRASVGFRPFASFGADLSVRSTRDLLPSVRLNPRAAAALDRERLRLGQLDFGREFRRSISSQLSWTPRLASWLSGEATLAGSFSADHDPAFVLVRAEDGDTTATPLRSFSSGRMLSVRTAVDPQALAAAFSAPGDSAAATRLPGGFRRLLGALRPLELGWRQGLDSRYDRTSGVPDLAYQLAMGGRDDLREIGGDSATLVADRDEWSARTQLALSSSLTLGAAYAHRRGEVFGRRSGQTDYKTDWPNLTVQWSTLPLPSFARPALRTLSLSSGYTRRARGTRDALAADSRSTTTSHIPVGIAALWNGGLSTGYRVERRFGAGESPFASTEQTGTDHSFTLAGSFAAPRALAPLFPEPLSLAVRYTRADRRECRLSFEFPVCSLRNEFVSYDDQVLGIQLDTRAAGMNFGVHVDSRDRQSRIGERNGNSHLSVSLFGQFNFSAGAIQ